MQGECRSSHMRGQLSHHSLSDHADFSPGMGAATPGIVVSYSTGVMRRTGGTVRDFEKPSAARTHDQTLISHENRRSEPHHGQKSEVTTSRHSHLRRSGHYFSDDFHLYDEAAARRDDNGSHEIIFMGFFGLV